MAACYLKWKQLFLHDTRTLISHLSMPSTVMIQRRLWAKIREEEVGTHSGQPHRIMWLMHCGPKALSLNAVRNRSYGRFQGRVSWKPVCTAEYLEPACGPPQASTEWNPKGPKVTVTPTHLKLQGYTKPARTDQLRLVWCAFVWVTPVQIAHLSVLHFALL